MSAFFFTFNVSTITPAVYSSLLEGHLLFKLPIKVLSFLYLSHFGFFYNAAAQLEGFKFKVVDEEVAPAPPLAPPPLIPPPPPTPPIKPVKPKFFF